MNTTPTSDQPEHDNQRPRIADPNTDQGATDAGTDPAGEAEDATTDAGPAADDAEADDEVEQTNDDGERAEGPA